MKRKRKNGEQNEEIDNQNCAAFPRGLEFSSGGENQTAPKLTMKEKLLAGQRLFDPLDRADERVQLVEVARRPHDVHTPGRERDGQLRKTADVKIICMSAFRAKTAR